MYARTVTLINPLGLHSRPASEFADCAGKFVSRILVGRMGDAAAANGKSIIMLLSLGLAGGERITITAQGEDETPAVDALASLVGSGFGEGRGG